MFYERIGFFLEVANCLSFSEAAKRKHITQQTMSWHIASLEKEIGVKLFVRSTRSVNLTNAGKRLRNDFSKINDEIEVALSRVKDMAQDAGAALSVGFFEGLPSESFIMPLMEHLQQTHPDVSFEIMLSDMASVRHHLLDGTLDFCITTADDWKMWPGVEAHILRDLAFRIVLSSSHRLSSRKKIRLNDLKEETLYALPHGRIDRRAPYWQDSVPRRNLVTLPDLNNILINVRLGRGFTCLTEIIDRINDPCFKTFPIPFDDAKAPLLLIYRKEIHNQLLQNIIADIISYDMV